MYLYTDPAELKKRKGKWLWEEADYTEEVTIRRSEPIKDRMDIPLGHTWVVSSKESGNTVETLDGPPKGHPDRRKFSNRLAAARKLPYRDPAHAYEVQRKLRAGAKKAHTSLRGRAKEAGRRVKKAWGALRGNPKVNPAKLRRLTKL